MRVAEPKAPALSEIFDLIETYVRDSVRCMGEDNASRVLRSRLCWFVKGAAHNVNFRESIAQLNSEAETIEKIRWFEQLLAQHAKGVTPAPPGEYSVA